MANQIMVIRPYRQHGTWVFDDPARGLVQEPFVHGVPEIIDTLVEDIEDAKTGFRLLFSADPFPGYQVCANRLDPEMDGWWYEADGMEGWLCPAMLKYFPSAPEKIYARAEPIRAEDKVAVGQTDLEAS